MQSAYILQMALKNYPHHFCVVHRPQKKKLLKVILHRLNLQIVLEQAMPYVDTRRDDRPIFLRGDMGAVSSDIVVVL